MGERVHFLVEGQPFCGAGGDRGSVWLGETTCERCVELAMETVTPESIAACLDGLKGGSGG